MLESFTPVAQQSKEHVSVCIDLAMETIESRAYASELVDLSKTHGFSSMILHLWVMGHFVAL